MARACVIVLDAVGAGALPDAEAFGDEGSDTLGNVARAVGGLDLPNMEALGLGNVAPLEGCPPQPGAPAVAGRLVARSKGKDTTTGHWELMGVVTPNPMPTYPHGFPHDVIDPFMHRTGRGVLGNKPASGTEIIQELGDQHRQTGDLIVYTSGDSVFQIAAHEETVPIEEQYQICRIARAILDPHQVGRVIARPFVGARAGEYVRTYNRKDFAMPPPAPTVLDSLVGASLPVVGVGKIPDIYCHRGISEEIHTEGNHDGMTRTRELMQRVERGLIFVNLVDFDSLYGHRRDPAGYYRCLREFDQDLAALSSQIDPGRDLVLITADHGNDPTFPGSDHTREYVPLLAFGPTSAAGVDLGTRASFADVGATLAEVFGVAAPPHGQSFLRAITGAS
jgi:phosphopentomutase